MKPIPLILIIGIPLFIGLAYVQGKYVNTGFNNDQGAFMKYAIELKENNYGYVGGRNRMPIYPAILSLFHTTGIEQFTYFNRLKAVNVVISLSILLSIYLLFQKKLVNKLHALIITSIFAFSIFCFKAPYVLCETLFYGAIFFLFIAILELLKNPGYKWAIISGLLAATSFLIKASVLPMVALATVLLIYMLASSSMAHLLKKRDGTADIRKYAKSLLFPIVFLIVISPYILKSKQVYGQYFYNVNSTFYMWYDSWEEVNKGVKAHGDRLGWPDVPDAEIPSMNKYFHEHTGSEIAGRIAEGVIAIAYRAFNSYGYLQFIAAMLIFLTMLLYQNAGFSFKTLMRKLNTRTLFIIGFFAGYFLLFAWYARITSGNRFILTLCIPLVYILCLSIKKYSDRDAHLKVLQHKIHPTSIYPTLSLLLIIYIVIELPFKIGAIYGGT